MNFNKAYDEIIGVHEIGYCDDPDDKGEETFNGISRKFNPDWSGWNIIDVAKKRPDFPKNLSKVNGLKELEKLFYKRKYWDSFDGDSIPYQIAVELFDIAVNCGVQTAVAWLQRTLNLLNNKGTLYLNIISDGKFGKDTKDKLKHAVNMRGVERIVKLLNIFQGWHYIKLMENNESQEKFIGWFNRV